MIVSGDSNKHTLTNEELARLFKDANALYVLYNMIGRGNVSEFEWIDAYIKGELPELIKEKCDG